MDHISDVPLQGKPQPIDGGALTKRKTCRCATPYFGNVAQPKDEDLTCPACLGQGWVHFPSARCSWCAGTGRIERPDLPTPEEQIDYTEMLEREDDIADDLARADEAAWREENNG